MAGRGSETAGARDAGRIEDQEKTEVSIIGRDEADRKPTAHLAALLALKAYSLHELADGSFLISRWDRSAHCSDLAGVRNFYERLGGITL